VHTTRLFYAMRSKAWFVDDALADHSREFDRLCP